jgi:4'-phosphopantetheinyl transferase EntD
VVGSITHCDDYCAVVVAPQSDIAGIGVDVETAAPLEASVQEFVCSAREIEQIDTLMRTGLTAASKLIFSAKESIYKCLYPLTRIDLDFHDIDVVLDVERGAFSFRVDAERGVTVEGEAVCHFNVTDARVATGVTLANAPG